MTVAVSAPASLAQKLTDGLSELGCAVTGFTGPPTGLEELGHLDALVHAPVIAGLREAALADIDEEAWTSQAEAPIWEALVQFQAAHAVFERLGGGAIVAALPTIALTGAPGLVPFATAAEGIRQLVKSAARAWGQKRIRVNCLTLPVEEWITPSQHVPNRYGASLPGPNADSDIAGAVAMLISPFARGVTGATLGLDRGTVLAP
jgi:3-oxoacyl-[acyl-carrier protein] reductase